jgi:hypothetical protein
MCKCYWFCMDSPKNCSFDELCEQGEANWQLQQTTQLRLKNKKCPFWNSQKQYTGGTDPRGAGNELTEKFYIYAMI